jgi:hypothetical protein
MVAIIYKCVRLNHGTHVEDYSKNRRDRDNRVYETRFTPQESTMDHPLILHISSQTSQVLTLLVVKKRCLARQGKSRLLRNSPKRMKSLNFNFTSSVWYIPEFHIKL